MKRDPSHKSNCALRNGLGPCGCSRRGSVGQEPAINNYDGFVDDFWFVDGANVGGVPLPAYLGLCIAGEASEVAEKLKKAYRDNEGFVCSEDMANELGDVLYYIVKYAHVLGYSLQDVVDLNVEKLRGRMSRGSLRGTGDQR